jgi:outer membrane protein OmpA-like peptidoglycan-associated protein
MEKDMRLILRVLLGLGLLGFTGLSPTAQTQQEEPASNVISKTVHAIGFQVGGGGTKVDMKGTQLMPSAGGEAKIEAKKALTTIQVSLTDMTDPSRYGTEFLTYVLWAVSSEGRTINLGELLRNNSGEAELNATTQLQTFSLVVTAEPYFNVRLPSEIVVVESQIRKNTKGKIFPVTEYKLMKRNQYEKLGNPLALTVDLKNVPLDMYEARNAVDIAKSRGADKYAPEIFSKAQASLQSAETALANKANKKDIISTARQTVQFSEDARALAAQRQEEERITTEREAAAAKAKAEAEAKAAAEAKRQAELSAAREAQMKAEAELAAAKAKAEQDALRAKEEAAKAEAERNRKAAEELRARLLDQFNSILPTTDTDRGLKVNMADVLFDTGKYDLRPAAREALAKFSGIVIAHPGLKLDVEGHTDSVGGDAFNQQLSEQRANAVMQFLVSQGVSQNSLRSQGFGKSDPIASNDTLQGRQQNRRVEIIISGEVIGTKIGGSGSS